MRLVKVYKWGGSRNSITIYEEGMKFVLAFFCPELDQEFAFDTFDFTLDDKDTVFNECLEHARRVLQLMQCPDEMQTNE